MNTNSSSAKVTPDELTEGFRRVGLEEGDAILMHASLESLGEVEGGAAMVLHRLLGVLGKNGTLVMPAFTSISRHAALHDGFSKPGCWCAGLEHKHVPFISELQPDREIGSIAHRLCSWPDSRRSRHPAYSFVAVGKGRDELVSRYDAANPLLPVKKLLARNPKVLAIGRELTSAVCIHLAEEQWVPAKFTMERALTVSSKGQTWVDIKAVGCSRGFDKLREHLAESGFTQTRIGTADVNTYDMRSLVQSASRLLEENKRALTCDFESCLSCRA